MGKIKHKTIQLTPVEEELMTILWQKGPGTVKEVMSHLSSTRKLAYTSVSTILRILEKKEIVSSKKQGRSHLYVPKISLDAYTKTTINKIINRSFAGNPTALANYLFDNYKLTSSEISEIENLIKEKLEKRA